MISTKVSGYILTDQTLETACTVIDRSGATDYVDDTAAQHRGYGGRKPGGIVPGIRVVLVIGLATLIIGRAPSIAEIHRTITALSLSQRNLLGLPGEGTIIGYPAFHAWLTRLLQPFDSGLDLPARRVINRDHRATLAARTPAEKLASTDAAARRHILINLLVAGSIDEKNPDGGAGDVVADETIIDLAGTSEGLGSKDSKHRGAAYLGGYYFRDRILNTASSGQPTKVVNKAGFGIGVTAVSRVGSAANLYGIPPVITGIAVHSPTSGSLAGLGDALRAHRDNGFDQRLSSKPNAKLPNLCVDMGYSVKLGFSSLVLEHGYAPVVRFPKTRQTIWASDDEVHIYRGQAAGPIQINGVFYCPAALHLAKGKKLVGRLNDLLEDKDGFDAQDQALKKLLPLMMGTNSRPRKARSTTGRPRQGESSGDTECYKIDLVCPAVQGRVRCPLKPDSMTVAFDQQLIAPEWEAQRFRCCSQSQVTLTYSREQWKLAQWGLVPGSWEHAIYYEAARSLTEQRFSIMKSQHTTGLDHLKWSPRREPLLCILIALWVAATNLAIQDAHVSRPPEPSSIEKRFRQLKKFLGRAPVKTPPRT